MEKRILLIFNIFIFLLLINSCNAPNPGFRIVCVYQTRFGVESPLAFALTKGNLVQAADNYSGNVTTFQKTSSGAGHFDVDDGRAPGFWRFIALANWRNCTGQTDSGGVLRGTENYLTCSERGFILPFSPSTIYTADPPIQFQMTVEGIDTTFGLPMFHFIDSYGTTIAITRATEVNGYVAKGWSECLQNLPIGIYDVKLYNAQDPNLRETKNALGTSVVNIRNFRPPNQCNPTTELVESCPVNFSYQRCQCN
jgi:hypothetical protein